MSSQAIRPSLAILALLLVPLGILAVGTALTPAATDFLCFWTGSHLTLEGRDPYDGATWAGATAVSHVDMFGAERPGNCPGRYAYPLTTAIAMIPLGALPIGVAAALWQAAFVVGLSAGLLLLARAARLRRDETLMLVVLVAASQPLEYGLSGAGFGGLVVLAAGLLATPELRAGAAAGTLLASLKPHVIPLAVLVRLRGLAPYAIALAFAPLVALAAVSLVVDPAWPGKWGEELVGHRREMLGESVTLWTLGRVVGAPSIGPLLIGVGLVALGSVAWRSRGRVDGLDAIALSIVGWQLVVPYGLSGDHLAPLAVTATVVMRRAIATPSPAVPVALFAVAGVLPWLLYGLRYDVLVFGGLEVANALVPLAMAILLAVALVSAPTRIRRAVGSG